MVSLNLSYWRRAAGEDEAFGLRASD